MYGDPRYDCTDIITEANRLLREYATVTTYAQSIPLTSKIGDCIRNLDLNGETAAENAIRAEARRLQHFVSIRCRHHSDRTNPHSIINHYPAGHPKRVRYEERVASELRELAAFDLAQAEANLAGVDRALETIEAETFRVSSVRAFAALVAGLVPAKAVA